MNNGSYIGRVTKDFTVNGKMGTTTVAVDRPYPFDKGQDGKKATDFLTIKIIGERNVQRATQYLTKGIKIAFQGHTFRDAWKDNNGNWKESNYIMVTSWEFAESKGSNGGASNTVASNGGDFMSIPDEISDSELPFN